MSLTIGIVGPNESDDLATNIHAALVQMGFDSSLLGPVVSRCRPHRLSQALELSRRSPVLGSFWEQRLISRARAAEINVLITVTSLRPESIQLCRDLGIATALWFPDSVANLGANWMFEAPYDALFFKEPDLVSRLRSTTKLPIYYLPEACNPELHRINYDGPSDDHIVIIGNLYPTRARLLERLIEDGYSLKIYGSPAHAEKYPQLAGFHQRKYLRGLEKSTAFRRARCTINSLHPSEMSGMNCRLFEATAAGAAVVTESRPELGRLFDLAAEVRSYSSYVELRESLEEIFASPVAARTMGDAASRRAHQDHTYEHRLTDLLSKIL